MKRTMKFLKSQSKGVIVGLVSGVLLTSMIGYATTSTPSNDVYYDNSNSTLSATTVQEALDELYMKVNPPAVSVTNYITNLYNSASQTSVTTAGGEEIIQASSVGLMQDSFGNIRYYGTSPNNYVSFNDETWRIIGVFDVEDENGNIEERVKLIRDESIGEYAYDSNEKNDWSTASLKTYLNGDYYNDLTADAKSMIGETKYYLGGSGNFQQYANNYYTFERGTTVYSGNSTTWIGNIGIMYPSDYGYATDLSICTYNLYLYSSDSCYKNNWLYRGYFEWLITASDDTIEEGLFGGVAFYLAGGHVSCQDEGGAELFTSMSKNIRPVLYLKSDIAITGGSGTIDDMYTLG